MQHLLIVGGHDVGDAQVGQHHGAHTQDLHANIAEEESFNKIEPDNHHIPAPKQRLCLSSESACLEVVRTSLPLNSDYV